MSLNTLFPGGGAGSGVIASVPSVARGRAPVVGVIFDTTLGRQLISSGREWYRSDGVPADTAFINLEGVSSAAPTIALDFRNGRYFGASPEACLSRVGPASSAPNRDGSTSPFAANALRITDVGLSYDGSAEVIQFAGPLLAAVNSGAGTLVVEFDNNTVNNSILLSSVSGTFIGRGGNGVIFSNYNGSQNLSANTTGSGNGGNADSNSMIVGQKWNVSTPTRSIAVGGGTLATDANSIGNLSTVYVGRNNAGSLTYTGRILGIWYYAAQLTDAELQAATKLSLTSKCYTVAYGDSEPAGSGAAPDTSASWRFLLAARYNGRVAQNGNLRGDLAVGGTTSSQALTAMQGSSVSRQRIHLLWTGTNNPNAAQTLSDLKAMVAILTAAGNFRFLIIPPMQNTGNAVGSAPYQAVNDTRAAIFANFNPANVFDAAAALGSTISGTDAGYTPAQYLADTVHPNNAGQLVLANAVEAKLRANGWL